MNNTLRVADVMTSSVHTIDGLASVADAVAAMKQHDVSSLVVDRRDEADEYGIVVVADIAAVIAENRPLGRTHVYEIMSKPMVTVPADMLARYAVRLLARFNVSRAIAVDGRNIAGIVTQRDLVLALAE